MRLFSIIYQSHIGPGRCGFGAALVVVMTLSFPSHAVAQTPDMPLPPPPPKGPIGQMRFGRLTVTPSFGVGNIGLDTNVYNSQGERKKDLIVSMGPQLQMVYKSDRMTLDGIGFAPYSFYKTFKDQRGFSRGVIFRGEVRIGPRLSVFSNDQFAFLKDRPSVEIDTRTSRIGSDLSGGVRFAVTRKLGLVIRDDERRLAYGSSESFRGVKLETLNELRREISLGLSFKLTPYTTLGVGTSVSRVRFANAGDRDSTSRGYSIGASFDPRALLGGNITFGWGTLKSHAGVVTPYAGLLSSGRLMYKLTNSTGISFAMNRSLQPSFDPGTPYYVNAMYDISLQQRLGRLFDVGVGDTYYSNDYSHFVTTADGRSVRRPETVNSAGVGFGFLTPRWGRYSVYVSQWQWHSNDPRNDYKGIRVGFLITPTRWLSVGSDNRTLNSPWLNMTNDRVLFTPRF